MQRPTILIVDDDPDLRRVLSRMLARDYEVSEAGTGASGLEQFRLRGPDLVLLDLHLPDTNGIAVLGEMMKLRPLSKVVMMTGQADIDSAVTAMKLGATDYLRKPVTTDQVRAAARAILQRGSRSSRGGLAKEIVGESPEMRQVWESIDRYALPDIGILLLGESGTGKELFARAIHARSKRCDGPFVALDCATLPDTLVESEIFGHEKGAFTGATDRRTGRFEAADGGTLFLDEIGNLDPAVQAKLLRVVQERYVERLGGSRPIPIDVRIVSATNLDLEQAIRKGAFREDLYYRLAEIVIRIPSLRERRNDVEVLARHFLREFGARFGRHVTGFTTEAWTLLVEHRWPGNVRELENVIKSSVLGAEGEIGPDDLPEYLRRRKGAPAPTGTDLAERLRSEIEAGLERGALDLKGIAAMHAEEAERAVLSELLQRRNFTQAELSELVAVDPKTLRAKLQKFGLKTR